MKYLFLVVFCACTVLFVSSCEDYIDKSNLASFKGFTCASYLETDTNFRSFFKVLKRVKLSNRSESVLAELLSTRGNYTVFAPTNQAIKDYLDSLSVLAPQRLTLENMPDSIAVDIAKNAIIDNGDMPAYLSTEFIEGTLQKTNMNGRDITVLFDTLEGGKSVIVVNQKSHIVHADIDLENGIIHEVNRVVSPSTAFLAELINETEGLSIFGLLLKKTGWDLKMQKYRDREYDDFLNTTSSTVREKYPATRNYGYTAFVESDEVFHTKWDIPMPVRINGLVTNEEEIMNAIRDKCEVTYPDATDANLLSEDNAINQFVSYHVLPFKLRPAQFVVHNCELGYNKQTKQLGINCHEYYETIGKQRRLLKFTEGVTTGGVRINRLVEYNLEDYSERQVHLRGVGVSNTLADYNALNGFYYLIDDMLLYTSEVPNKVLNERLRWDFSSILPEMLTNNFRRLDDNKEVVIPTKEYPYFSNMEFKNNATYVYMPQYTGFNYQSDEHNITGKYDVVIKLPPVPYAGTWEFRITSAIYPANRSMAQLYFGTNKNNLQPVGLPLDMRYPPLTGVWKDDYQGGYASGTRLSEAEILEVDKSLRSQGYMKACMHDGSNNIPFRCRDDGNETWGYARLRYIVYSGYMEPETTYYFRCKNLLTDMSRMFVLDYIELCPKSIYNNSAKPEDRW